MDFFEIEPGDRVVELMAAGGYYTALLADRVGGDGKVWAHNSPFVLERFAERQISARMERLDARGIRHVERLDHPLDDPHLPAEVDAVVMVLFYHDTYWQDVDRAAMNAAVFAALRPGGVFGIVDHHAEPGAGERDVKTLHRVDEALVTQEVLAAGFELDATSELLRNTEDPRTANVFAAAKQGRDQTDRFVLRFRKPRTP
jgi:predicted methyltransferase